MDLRRGRNQFEVSAVDPDTGKRSEDTVRLFITVPFLLRSRRRRSTVDQPADGASFENGAIPVAGRATNADVRRGQRDLRRPIRAGRGRTARRSRRQPPAGPTPITVQVAEDGSFSTPYELTAGRWSITVTAASPQGKTAALTRNVTVAYKGVNLVVTIKGGRAWLKVWVDGKLDPEPRRRRFGHRRAARP